MQNENGLERKSSRYQMSHVNDPTLKELDQLENSKYAGEVIEKEPEPIDSLGEHWKAAEAITKGLRDENVTATAGVAGADEPDWPDRNDDVKLMSDEESDSIVREIPIVKGELAPGGGVYDQASLTKDKEDGVLVEQPEITLDFGILDGLHEVSKIASAMKPDGHKGLSVRNLTYIFENYQDNMGKILDHDPRLFSITHQFGNDRYLSMCCSISGRTCPWKPMFLLLIWCFVLYLLHGFGRGYLPGFDFTMNSWLYKVVGVSVGFLLKTQAMVANDRWWEARKNWEHLMLRMRLLCLYLVSVAECAELRREVLTYAQGATICIKNYLMDIADDVWESQLEMVLSKEDCERVMKYRPRIRWTFCLYASQRVIEYMVKTGILPAACVRDLNPQLLKLSNDASNCARIRLTQIPWSYIMHVRLLLMIYMMYVPLLLVGLPEMTWGVIVFYFLPIAYAFAGLESMSSEILNPFTQSESDHPLDLYCYLVLTSTQYMAGKDFNERVNFAESFDRDHMERWISWLYKRVKGFVYIAPMRKPKTDADEADKQLKSSTKIHL